MSRSKSSVLVTGDFVFDHHIYQGHRHHYGDGVSPGVRVFKQLGGAALTHALLRSLLPGPQKGDDPPPAWESRLAIKERPPRKVTPGEQAYAFWRPFPPKAPKQHWRVSEAMGFGDTQRKPPCTTWDPADNLPPEPEIIVLSEGGMGFRGTEECWRDLPFRRARWIVLKTAAPLASGTLWHTLVRGHRDKLVVLLSSSELRKSAAHVSQGLSWEATVQSFLRELRPGSALHGLTQCRHLIVTLSSEAGVWIDLSDGDDEPRSASVHFVYEAGSIEGEHAAEVKGSAFGFLSCVAAAVVWRLAVDGDAPDLASAIEGGLSAMRDLRERGHGDATEEPKGFPASRLAEAIKHPGYRYSRAALPLDAELATTAEETGTMQSHGAAMSWSFTSEAERDPGPAYELARLVVLRGPIALENRPHLRVRGLLTVDRNEIESLRAVTRAIRRYRDHDSGSKPLSVGVFGPPGAGKSFAVKELAGSLVGDKSWKEFNLSQFDTPADLTGAFHQVRDLVLQGHLPVVFFDEFDSQEYRWLQHLLAPMQDGKFQEGQLTHSLGKCIFVLAGGTSWTFETFGPQAPGPGQPESEPYEKFRLAKGPDLKSRLDVYIDVLGPNQRRISPPPPGTRPTASISGHEFGEDPTDIFFPVRRALMIRHGLGCSSEEKLDIDEGLLHALLRVGSYRHGARSLNKLLQPLRSARQAPIYRSQLPAPPVVAMHTDGKESFLELCASDLPPRRDEKLGAAEIEEIVGVMAPSIHETYNDLGLREGWLDPKKKKGFHDLSELFKESNRQAARRMFRVLALVGLRLAPGSASSEDERSFRQYLEYHLDLLAEAEHEGWMDWYLENGWRYSPQRDDEDKRHNCLLPFQELKDVDKNKDRTTIRHYLEFARGAKTKIEFIA